MFHTKNLQHIPYDLNLMSFKANNLIHFTKSDQTVQMKCIIKTLIKKQENSTGFLSVGPECRSVSGNTCDTSR